MRLERIEFQNIGSYGNKMQEITFNNEGKLILLQGKSGSGKSTLLNLPSILFYGKVEKQSKSGIANRINKNGYIKGTIITNGCEYVIERKFSPNSVMVFKDGVDINSIGVKDAQEFINDNIVGLPYQIFTNVISLSMTKFKSFLNMSPEDRRQIIDRVFNLEVVNMIYQLIKKDLRDVGLAINADNTQIYTLNETILKANQELNRLSQDNNSQNNDKISTNNFLIDQESKKIAAYNTKYNEFNNIYKEYLAQYQKLQSDKQQVDIAKNILEQRLNLFNQEKCPTCGTSFNSEEFIGIKNSLVEKIQKSTEMVNSLVAQMNEISGKTSSITQAMQTISSAIGTSNQSINKAQAENHSLQSMIRETAEFKSIQNIISSNNESLIAAKKKLDDDNEKWNDLMTLSTLYSIDGVKKQVIKNYLPQLNKEIKQTLIRLDFPYDLEFDDNFNSILSYLGNPIGTDTLSDGEHKRVDLAVLCSIFKLLKRKYPTINIFTLDEVLSSIDKATCGDILRLLKEFALEMKLNLFVVTHVDMETELFDEQINVFKEMGFSDFTIDYKL